VPVDVGSSVLTLGYPLSTFTVTQGIVSALDPFEDEGHPYIQTDSAINPGNSGGPLLDMLGNFVGLVTSRTEFIDGRIIQNVGYAISLGELEGILTELQGGLVVAQPTPTPVLTKRVGSYPDGFSLEIPRRWTQYHFEDWDCEYYSSLGKSLDCSFVHRVYRKGDWVYCDDICFSDSDYPSTDGMLSVRIRETREYDAAIVMSQLKGEIEKPNIKLEIVEEMGIQLTNGVAATKYTFSVHYWTDVGYTVERQGIWTSIWVIAVLDDRWVAAEAVMYGDDEKTKAGLEVALISLQVFSPD
jgi:hypothetical protein